MADSLPHSVMCRQPHSVVGLTYGQPMTKELKTIIRNNVRTLLAIPDGQPGVAQVMRLGFSNGTATRILDDSTSIGVDVVEKLAAKLGIEPWQLCVPGIEPDRLPTTEPASFRWPFRNIDPDVITGLVGTAAQGIENGLMASLATLGISPRKQQRTG